MSQERFCPVCNRLHKKNQPCPQRIACAYIMKPGATEALTEADKLWMAHNKFSALEVLEEELANRMQEEMK